MITKIFTIICVLIFIVRFFLNRDKNKSNNGVQIQNKISPYDYELSPDGFELIKWKNDKTETIDMNSDDKLKKVSIIGDNVFCKNTNLKNVNISNSVTKIGNKAFAYCSNLKNINIPQSVRSIGDNAFYECKKLVDINIPSSLTIIKEYTFYGCTSLNSITLRSPQIIEYTEDLLNDTPNLRNIYVPENLVWEYRKAQGWKDFSSKIRAISF